MKAFTAILLMTTMLTSGVMIATPARADNNIIASETGTTKVPATKYLKGERESAAQFVHLLSQARYSLSIEDPASATKFINDANAIGKQIANVKEPISGIQSGRVDYEGSDDSDDFYYPINAGKVTQKEVGLGPFWADKKGLAVKDAEVVYLTVDLRDSDFQNELNESLQQIADKDYTAADDILDDIIDDVASIDSEEQAPEIKARDNLELANYYMNAKNYEGARYPLKHARAALEDMKDEERFKGQEAKIDSYLREIDRSEETIARKDPTALEAMQRDAKQWWTDVKAWADRKS